jgi:hypothetical protein
LIARAPLAPRNCGQSVSGEKYWPEPLDWPEPLARSARYPTSGRLAPDEEGSAAAFFLKRMFA